MRRRSVAELCWLYLTAVTDDFREPSSSKTTVEGVKGALEPVTDEDGVRAGLAELQTAGLVDEQVATIEEHGTEATMYVPTTVGRERAATLRGELSTQTVMTAQAGHLQEVPLVALGQTAIADGVVDVNDPVLGALIAIDADWIEIVEDSQSSDFVGREHELARLEWLWTSAEPVDPLRGVVLTGPTGIGKTALLTAFASRIRSQGGLVLFSRANKTDRTPYGPIRAALHSSGDPNALEPFTKLGGVDVDADTLEGQRRAMFTAVARTIDGFDPDGPTVLVVDDLQWVDGATLDLLSFIIERVDEPILLGAFNTDTAAADGDVSARLDEWVDAGRLERIELDALSTAALETMIETRFDATDVPEAFVEAVADQTGGAPLFVAESLGYLADEGLVDPEAGTYPTDPEAIPPPESIDAVVDTRLERLDDAQRRLLEAAAVSGEPVVLSVLSRVLDRPESSLRDTAGDLVTSDIWREAPQLGPPLTPTYRWENTLIFERIRAMVETDRRRDLHERIAAAYAEIGGTRKWERHATIAHHLERAGDSESAIDHFVEAASLATDVYAYDEAVEYLEVALGLAGDCSASDIGCSIRERLATIHCTTGAYEEAQHHVDRYREAAEDDPERTQHGMRLAADIATARGEYDRALDLVADGLAVSDGSLREQCALLAVRADAERGVSDYDSVVETATELYDVAVRIEAVTYKATANKQVAIVSHRRGDYESARTRYRKALKQYEKIGDSHGVATVKHGLGIVALKEGNLSEATEVLSDALETVQELGDRHHAAKAQTNLATAARERGQYREARSYTEEALETARTLGDSHLQASLTLNLGLTAESEGAYDTAYEYYEAAAAEFEAIGDDYHSAVALNNLATVQAERGDPERAKDYCDQSLEYFESVGNRSGIVTAKSTLGTILAKLGECDRARDVLVEAFDESESIGRTHRSAVICRELAEVAISRGEYDCAVDWLTKATQRFRELDATDETQHTLEMLTEVRSELSDSGSESSHR